MPAPEGDIRTWIATRNQDPKPFVWTKTADQILESPPHTADELLTQDTSLQVPKSEGKPHLPEPRPAVLHPLRRVQDTADLGR